MVTSELAARQRTVSPVSDESLENRISVSGPMSSVWVFEHMGRQI